MRKPLSRTAVMFVACLLLATRVLPVLAAGPAITMIYGDRLPKPLFALYSGVDDFYTLGFLTCAGSQNRVPLTEMGSRPYLRLSSFWNHNELSKYRADLSLLSQLKPEGAFQQGRLYLPTASEPAIVMSTGVLGAPPGWNPDVSGEFPPRPVPTAIKEFGKACSLAPADIAVARRLGIPGF